MQKGPGFLSTRALFLGADPLTTLLLQDTPYSFISFCISIGCPFMRNLQK
jgi:hypothetical protein